MYFMVPYTYNNIFTDFITISYNSYFYILCFVCKMDIAQASTEVEIATSYTDYSMHYTWLCNFHLHTLMYQYFYMKYVHL